MPVEGPPYAKGGTDGPVWRITMFAADESSAGPVAEYRERVVRLCEKFTRATGWTVRFVGDGHEVSGEGAHSGQVLSLIHISEPTRPY